MIRPIRPEDALIEQAFVQNLSPESKYLRFMQSLKRLTPIMLARFTQIDYTREMALIAVAGEGTTGGGVPGLTIEAHERHRVAAVGAIGDADGQWRPAADDRGRL